MGLLSHRAYPQPSSAPYATKLGNLDLLSASSKDVSLALGEGSITSVELVEAYLDRIEANNHKGMLTFMNGSLQELTGFRTEPSSSHRDGAGR